MSRRSNFKLINFGIFLNFINCDTNEAFSNMKISNLFERPNLKNNFMKTPHAKCNITNFSCKTLYTLCVTPTGSNLFFVIIVSETDKMLIKL